MLPNPLADRLAAEIAAKGPIGFDQFMSAALYDPEYGYYMGGGKPEEDFRTAVDTHPLFAAILARRLDRVWHKLGCPSHFGVLELGSGRGSMAAAVHRVARDLPWGCALRWTGVEIGTLRRRDAQRACPQAKFVRDLSHVAARPAGVVIANEYLDALPFRLGKRCATGWNELRVGSTGGDEFEFMETNADPEASEYCTRWGEAIPDGGIVEVREGIDDLFGELAGQFERSVAIFIDYGGSAEQVHSLRLSSGTALAYRAMQVSSNLLKNPGRQDLTAHVNFDAISESASHHGFSSRGLTTQAEYLIELGIGSYLPALSADPRIDRQRYEAEREAVTRLLDPRHMGSFKVLELERGLVALTDANQPPS